MVARWLKTLPQRGLREGLSRSLGENRIVSDTDTDGGKARPRSSNAPDPFQLQMRFTTDQVEIFWRFWKVDLGHGTGDFWFPAPATHGLALATSDGQLLTTETGAILTIDDWILTRFAPRQPPPAFGKRNNPLIHYSVFSLERLW
ncbi:hypothetical protein [Methylopila sp. M107]|uniref:hypothetical protein n=1 Tax=Methylopila sp. M107 TaxID=1101190 RepID=UPI000366A94A|nr:hypothetical protein [Methylopila sp. M107]